MLKCVLGAGRAQKRTLSRLARLNQKQTKQSDSREADGFKDEQISSIQEKTLFEQIFEQIMKKDEERKKSKNILKPFLAQNVSRFDKENTRERESVQIVFEKKKTLEGDAELSKFFKNAVGDNVDDTGGLARIITDDIRKYPVSLTPAYFTDGNSNTSPQDATNSLVPSTMDTYFEKDPIPGVVVARERGINPRILNQIETKHRLSSRLEQLLAPHILYLQNRIQNDSECITVLQEYLSQYLSRDLTLETKGFEHIEQESLKDPKRLPQPFHITMPFIIRHLLTSTDFCFPVDRRYTQISLIYNSCKRAADVSLYLNMCNIEFYNLLIEYAWENYQDIHQLKQLVTEMTANGILGDLHTVDLLESIAESMRHMNDGVVEDSEILQQAQTAGVVWCRENAHDLNYIEDYLRKLKESQT
ncbi:LANO_0A04236g1_1 [Lachancea nothofagi CBS 11611]|uniref:LANO_0A04236g1_1 n=1 Tax=Lachancea nothofagi CBS 11611 TaxID=1266666 RepID=A0A1G4IQ88_9SACH|nr:LANO_0A04236g1_1 [Lachancea nothofagi CBS 11611]